MGGGTWLCSVVTDRDASHSVNQVFGMQCIEVLRWKEVPSSSRFVGSSVTSKTSLTIKVKGPQQWGPMPRTWETEEEDYGSEVSLSYIAKLCLIENK